MNENYKAIELTKGIYKSEKGFNSYLEEKDPTKNYKGTELEGLDAFQRQLKRFDIRVSGKKSDRIEKFFSTTQSSALFPEYVRRAVVSGLGEGKTLDDIVATTTKIDSLDYRTITTCSGEDDLELKVVMEGGAIPQTEIKLKENLVKLIKRGRMLVCSYEAIKYQRLDLFTVALKEIGAKIGEAQLKDAINVLLNGSAGEEKAKEIKALQLGKLTYEDMLNLWSEFDGYEMNTILVSPDMMAKLLSMPEMKSQNALSFKDTGKLQTAFGANIIRSKSVPAGKLIAFDKRFALEKVVADDITVDYDKLIDCQLERAAVTSTAGFSRIVPDAVRVLSLN